MKDYTSEIYRVRMHAALQKYVPATAVSYCFSLWDRQPFSFKIKNPRLSKAGDYTYVPSKKLHIITVNKNLNRYSFLITFIHEVAHMVAFEKFGRKISPHGPEWKRTFTQLMQPLLIESVLPKDVLTCALRHFKNPKASTAGDPNLMRVLNTYDEHEDRDNTILDDVPVGRSFVFRRKQYVKLEKRRTRILCREHVSGKHYLISKAAVVDMAVK